MNSRTPTKPAAVPTPSASKPSVPATSGKPKNGFEDEEAEDGPWRHDPVAPKDEGIARSFGKSVSDVVTGPLDGADGKPKV